MRWPGDASTPPAVTRDRHGYGRLKAGDRETGAHRIADLEVCHHCDNPPCVRPDHLFVGTHAENMADMSAKGRGKAPIRPLRWTFHASSGVYCFLAPSTIGGGRGR